MRAFLREIVLAAIRFPVAARRPAAALLGAALMFGSVNPAQTADSSQQQKSHIYRPVTASTEAPQRSRLMASSAISGSPVTAEAHATVDVKSLGLLRPLRNLGALSDEVNANKTTVSLNTVKPADTPVLDPTVTVLPTPLGLQSPTDVPDFSMGASDQFIVSANSQTIYFQDRASNVLGSSTLAGFFANLGDNSPFDPMVSYDELTNRWFIAAPDNFGTSQSSILIGVSQTSDPTMTWGLYKVAADSSGQTSAGALSSIGGNTSFLVLSTAQLENSQPNAFQQSFVFEFDKNGLVTSNTLSGNKFTDSAYLPCPAKVYDTMYPFVDILTDFNGNSSGNGIIRRGFIATNQGQAQYVPSGESLSFGSTWAIFPPSINFLPQSGSSTGIDGGDGRIANVVMRNSMLFGVHSVYQPAGSPDHSAIHWLTEDLITGATQDGFFQGGGSTSYFKPSLGVTPTGGLAIAFNACSAGSFPSLGFAFRYAGQQSFLPFSTIKTGTGPSLNLKNGLNFGPNTSVVSPAVSGDEIAGRFLFDRTLVQGSPGSLTGTVLLNTPNLLYGLGTIAGDHGSASFAEAPPQGTPPDQYIFGNLFPSSIIGGSTLTGMQFYVPMVSGSIQPGQQLDLYYGVVSGTTPNGAQLTTQPFTVGQLNKFQTFTFPRPIQVPAGQGFYAGVSGAGGAPFMGVDTNVPLFGFSFSTPSGPGNFSKDPINFMVRIISTPPPCTSKLDKTERAFGAPGKKVCIAHGTANCKPTAISDVDWVVVDDMGFLPDTMEFNVLYHVLPNPSGDPRIGEISVNGEVFTVIQAGNNALAAINTTPNSAPAGSSGVKVTVTPSGRRTFSLRASATGFTSTTTVAWDGEGQDTTVVSPTELTANITAADLATQGAVPVTIFDLAPGGGTSPPVTFTVTAPGPDFGIALDQPTITTQAGTKAHVVVNITRTGGFTGNVTITPPAAQGGIKPKPPGPITTAGAGVVLKLKIGATVASGTHLLVIKGTDDAGQEHDVTLTLIIQ